jgi:hypothetical protein
MDTEHLWSVTELLIDQYGGVIAATPSNLPPHEGQHTENPTNSENSVQRPRSDSAISVASVPDVVYNLMLPNLNSLALGEKPYLPAQEYYSDSDIPDTTVPDVDHR